MPEVALTPSLILTWPSSTQTFYMLNVYLCSLAFLVSWKLSITSSARSFFLSFYLCLYSSSPLPACGVPAFEEKLRQKLDVGSNNAPKQLFSSEYLYLKAR